MKDRTLTHEERRVLINECSHLSFRVIERKTHAGTLIDRDLPGANTRRGGPSDGYSEYGGQSIATIEDLIVLNER